MRYGSAADITSVPVCIDGILIKENHIAAAGGIKPVLEQAFRLAKPGISVQIEVENTCATR